MPLVINETELNKYINSVIYQPGYSSWKNLKSEFIAVNNTTAKMLGFKNFAQMLGTTDYDLPGVSAKNAKVAIKTDQETLTLNTDRHLIFYGEYPDGWKLWYGSHTVIQNSQQDPIALAITALEITALPLLNMGIALNEILQERISQKRIFCMEVIENYRGLNLSKRQSECLFYILNGLTAKETAAILNISPRTVEAHIGQVKDLLKCHTKQQLREKSAEHNLLNLIIT